MSLDRRSFLGSAAAGGALLGLGDLAFLSRLRPVSAAEARLNDIDPQAWLADVLGRIAETPASRLDELLPWHWTQTTATPKAA